MLHRSGGGDPRTGSKPLTQLPLSSKTGPICVEQEYFCHVQFGQKGAYTPSFGCTSHPLALGLNE